MLKELKDYDGEFQPSLRLEDLSHETLVKLLTIYSQLYIGMDGFWYLAVQERSGDKEALACDFRAWERATRYEMKKITEGLDIRGNDVAAFMKALQLTPWCQKMEYKIDIADANNATLTVTYCPTLDALEKEGKGREVETCTVVEPWAMKQYASFFNPAIEVKCLAAPPREKKDGICCQWAFGFGTQAMETQ